MSDPIADVIVSAIVSVLVTYLLVPRMARRDEAARQDLAARRRVEAELGKVRMKLVRELRLRNLLQKRIQVGLTRLMTTYDFEEAVWSVLVALDDPALDRRVAEDVRRRLADLMGERTLEYIRTASEAPKTPSTIRETTERVIESGGLDDIFEQHHKAPDKAPVDAMFRSGDPKLVADILSRLDEIINAIH